MDCKSRNAACYGGSCCAANNTAADWVQWEETLVRPNVPDARRGGRPSHIPSIDQRQRRLTRKIASQPPVDPHAGTIPAPGTTFDATRFGDLPLDGARRHRDPRIDLAQVIAVPARWRTARRIVTDPSPHPDASRRHRRPDRAAWTRTVAGGPLSSPSQRREMRNTPSQPWSTQIRPRRLNPQLRPSSQLRLGNLVARAVRGCHGPVNRILAHVVAVACARAANSRWNRDSSRCAWTGTT